MGGTWRHRATRARAVDRRVRFFFSSRRRHTRYIGDWRFRRVLFRSRVPRIATIGTGTDEAQRLTALLERLREKCAEEAENHRDAISNSIARSIRAIELHVAVRE